jgi:hypothetical protein
LRWPDVDLDEGFVEVRRNIVQLGKQTEEGAPKSGESQRLIALDDDTMAVLRAHRDRQRKERADLGQPWAADGFVFATVEGGSLNPDYVSRHLTALIKVVAIPLITLHLTVCSPESPDAQISSPGGSTTSFVGPPGLPP